VTRRYAGRGPWSPGGAAAARIGEWPDQVSHRRHGAAKGHALGVWVDARSGAVNRAEALWTEVGGELPAFLGQVDLAFLATVAGHLRRCEKCWKPWIDGETPVELITRAVERTPAWEVFRPVVMEIHAQQGRGRRRGGK
jgi:hypothetical protein